MDEVPRRVAVKGVHTFPSRYFYCLNSKEILRHTPDNARMKWRDLLSLCFFAETVTFTLTPLTSICVSTRPCVSPAGLIAAVPSSFIAALAGGTRTDPVSVGLACRPATAVRAAVIERERAANLRLQPLVVGGQRLVVQRHRTSGS